MLLEIESFVLIIVPKGNNTGIFAPAEVALLEAELLKDLIVLNQGHLDHLFVLLVEEEELQRIFVEGGFKFDMRTELPDVVEQVVDFEHVQMAEGDAVFFGEVVRLLGCAVLCLRRLRMSES
jgi:hypothetical protein